jgi:hypothetical protein
MSDKPTRKCDRCGVAECDTPENVLAYNGPRLVCADCNSDLDNEWAAEDPQRTHPLNTLLWA